MSVHGDLHTALGLSNDELEAIVAGLGRRPSYTELAMFSVMWSEHCSYKSSRKHLERLPTRAEHVLVGPGEGAGVVEVARGVAVAWKVESHNHPSFVEPHNGAATGVGGIVRDVLSMGARPIALLDSLRFGPSSEVRTSYLVDGVVGGISSYGNAIGVPTVGGEMGFEPCYAANPLVNVACLGVLQGPPRRGRADGPGNLLMLIGSSTGRDGIGGASVLASAELDDSSADKRPSVQVGDPFTEKLLIEACLELCRKELLVGLQDLGAGGLACPASEMTSKAGTGAVVDLDRVHRREPGMAPFEVMISESQERMLAVVAPSHLDEAMDVCRRWELTATVVGEVTSSGRLEVRSEGEVVADVPARALTEEAPVYERPALEPSRRAAGNGAAGASPRSPGDLAGAVLDLLAEPSIASKRAVWEQYDHMVMLGTVAGPGGDAAVIRLPGTDVAVAIAVDGPGRLCRLDPYRGAMLAVAEAARNVACTGARPLAVTNCLNFGNPEKPEVMWAFSETVRGIGEACSALGTPVTGGNVSFYNETNGRAIYPTPVIGMLGVLGDPACAVPSGFRADDHDVLLLGATDPGDFGGSHLAASGAPDGIPPRLDLEREVALQAVLIEASAAGLIASAHDPSEGGLAVALAESAIAGGRGFAIELPRGVPWRQLFAESPSRAVVSCSRSERGDIFELASSRGVPAQWLGVTGGETLDFGAVSVPLSAAVHAHGTGFQRVASATMAR